MCNYIDSIMIVAKSLQIFNNKQDQYIKFTYNYIDPNLICRVICKQGLYYIHDENLVKNL